ncbi:MAG: S41 family peptidase [Fibrobacterota bacterium]
MKIKKGLPSFFCTIAVVATVGIGVFFDVTVAQSDVDFGSDTDQRQSNDRFYYGLHTLEKTLQRVFTGYVDTLNEDTLIRNAIDGALNSLDPYTIFYEPEDYEELRVRTEGEFGGLGIQISIRDDVLTVMTPIAGTPADRAGIRSGDQIIEIAGEPTKGITLEEAVNKMRGEPGTEITIRISRKGESDLIDYTIERDIIEIEVIPHAGLIRGNTGYIRLNSFSSVSADSVRANIDSLMNEGMEQLVFDLRANPGGLLEQAVNVADVFLPKNKMVVFTEGRLDNAKEEYHTRYESAIPEDMPLVVLVNEASASASEIVAGAIQDWDRGVIAGKPSFGKGSVQTVIPIDRTDNRYLKMTTAYYHTPSGRNINKPHSDDDDEEKENGEEEFSELPDTVDIDSSEVYHTKNLGRKVFGGGGIVPDTLIEANDYDLVIRSLLADDLFFQFANTYYPVMEADSIRITPEYEIPDSLIERFLSFADSAGFEYNSVASERLRQFKVYSGFEEDTAIDERVLERLKSNFSTEDSLALTSHIDKLEKILEESERAALLDNTDAIKHELFMALLIRQDGRDNSTFQRINISRDDQINTALDILSNSTVYNEILNK